MTNPKVGGPAYSVTCYTCYHKIWDGDTAPADGQQILTTYAEQTPGPCPSGVAACPHKTSAIAAASLLRPATVGDLAAVKTRLSAVEAKVTVKP
jgi:hypothetical protein